MEQEAWYSRRLRSANFLQKEITSIKVT